MNKKWLPHVIAVAASAAFIGSGLACSTVTGYNQPSSPAAVDELDITIRKASDYLNEKIPRGNKIAITNIQSDSSDLSDYIIDKLIANAVNDKVFIVVERRQFDVIREEQNIQLSGEVDDDEALSIGKSSGAQTIVLGTVTRIGDRYRMTIRALKVENAEVQAYESWNIAYRIITIFIPPPIPPPKTTGEKIGAGTLNILFGLGSYLDRDITGGIIYGYSAGDTVNSNVVKNDSGTVVSNNGHAVYAGIWDGQTQTYINPKRRETTAGIGVTLSFDGKVDPPTFSGGWEN